MSIEAQVVAIASGQSPAPSAHATTSDERRRSMLACSHLCVRCYPLAAPAGVLPEDRADVLYHRYDGGGVTIHGPSVLVRKKMAEKYSRQRQLLHGHGDERVDRRRSERRERIQGRARSVQARRRVPARQDHVQLELHEQRRERLRGRDRELRPEPGPVRRPHDDQHGVFEGRRHRASDDRGPGGRRRIVDPPSRRTSIAGAIASASRRS